MQVERIGVSKWPFSPDVYLKGTSYPITASEADRMHRETLRSQAAQIVNSTLSKNESYQYWAIILAVFPVITVFGNVLVVLSVLRESNLHTATNYFIVSLAGADIGLAILVMPLSGWVEANNGNWSYGTVFCDIFNMFDVMLCTASILNLAAISLDRYVAVTKPIVYSKHNNNYRVSLTIALAWILSFVIALPIACGLNNVADRQTNMCALFNPEYIITSSIGSFYIPCGIMIILYYRVFHTIRGRTKYITFTSNSTMKPLNKSAHIIKLCTDVAVVSRDVNANESISPMMKPYNESLSPSCSLDGCESNFSVTVTDSFPTSSKDSCAPIPHLDQPRQVPMLENTSFIYTNQNAVVHHAAAEPNGTNSISTDTDTIRTYGTDKEFKDMDQFRKHLKNRIRQAKRCSLSVFPVQYSTVSGQQIYSMGKPSRRAPLSVRVSDSVRKKLTATRSFITKGSLTSRCGDNRELNGNNGHFKTLFRNKGLNLTNTSNQVMSKDRTSAKLERKATKTLAIVLGVFLICWMPFFTINITHAFCFKYKTLGDMSICNLPRICDSIAVWLGYINSSLNPVIYTIFNVEFRKAFKKLLHLS